MALQHSPTLTINPANKVRFLKLEYSRLQGLHQELRVEHAQVQSKNAPLRTMWRFRKDSFQPRYSSKKTLG